MTIGTRCAAAKLAVVALLATGGLAGCSSKPPAAGPTTSPTPVHPKPTLVHPKRTVTVHPAETGNVLVTLADRTITEVRSRRDPKADQLVLVDRRTGTRAVVVTSAFRPGQIDAAAAAGDWVVFFDHRGAVTNGDVPYLWQVSAINTRTKQRLVLDGNRKPDLARVELWTAQHAFAWSETKDSGQQFGIWKPGWSKPRIVTDLPTSYAKVE